MKRQVVIVDPYSSGNLLAGRFRAAGFETIAVHLRPLQGLLGKSYIAADFSHSYFYDGSIGTLLSILRDHDVAMVVPGHEAGVELADALNDGLGLASNAIGTSHARRDKYAMHQQIAAHGLRSIAQLRSGDFGAVAAWVDRHQAWPVVVKPVNSAGTDGVKVCHSLAQVRAAFDAIIDAVNLLGLTNEEVLVQEFIDGVEYVVDMVSAGGEHYVASMTRYRKEILADGSPIYKEMAFFAPGTPLHEEIVAYVRQVLDALGVRVGPSHTEVFVDAAGPVLVESGARMFGGGIPRFQERATAVSPLDLAVDAYIAPERFYARTRTPQRYDATLVILMMSTPRGGRIAAQPGRALVAALPSYYEALWFFGPGDEVGPTRDISSGVGLLVLLSADHDQVARDIAQASAWEAEERFLSFAGDA